MLLPGFIGPGGSESNSKITRSTSGRDGADGTRAADGATNSVPFTDPSVECATDATGGALPASFGAEDTTAISTKDLEALALDEAPTTAAATHCISDSADDEDDEAVGDKLQRGENVDQDRR